MVRAPYYCSTNPITLSSMAYQEYTEYDGACQQVARPRRGRSLAWVEAEQWSYGPTSFWPRHEPGVLPADLVQETARAS